VSFTDEVKLRHWQKDLSFDFVALHYAEPEDNQYSWRLEPYEEHWSTPSKRRTATYTNLPPGTYTFRVRGSNVDGIWNEEGDMIRIIITPPWWATWWAYAIYALLFVGLTRGIIVYRSRQLKKDNIRLESQVKERTARLKQSLEDLKASQAQLIESEKNAIQVQLLGLERKALQAQMNPHFVFNAMNSVQHLIASGEDKQAMLYLNKFGKLLRSVLDHSDHGFVSLLTEVEMLQNYIALEALRFEDVFQYRIDVDPSLEYDDIRIPGFIIQPVIENAIQHGLLPRKTGGILSVALVDQGEHINCIVEDNGVGRSNRKSAELQDHESKGLKLLRRRLEMLSPGIQTKVINIVDLKFPAGETMGTRVEIRLPVLNQAHVKDSHN
jgi:two-component sensor histidine kinase